MGEVEELHDWEILQTTDTGFFDLSLRPDYFAVGRRVSSVHFDTNSSDLLSDPGSEVVVTPKVVDFDGKLELDCEDDSSQVEFYGIDVESKDDGPVSEKNREFGGNHEEGCEDVLRNDVRFEGICEIQEFEGVEVKGKDDGSVSEEIREFGGNHEADCEDVLINDVSFQRIGEIQEFEGIEVRGKDDGGEDGSVSEEIRDFGGNHEMGYEDDFINDVNFQGIQEINEKSNDDSEKITLDSTVSEMGNSGGELVCASIEQIGDGEIVERSESCGVGDEIEGGGAPHELKSVEGENIRVVWWKLPLELLKFCAFRVSPVWSLSIAAAVMGLVILRRRMSRMKRKSRSIPIKLTVEDKKVSQFMIRAARLNEAFSVVKRVPIIRPLLPAAGSTPWPVLNLR